MRPTSIRKLIALSLLASFALTGCGVTGSLKTPPPLFGDKTKVPTEKTDVEAPLEDDRDLIEVLEELED